MLQLHKEAGIKLHAHKTRLFAKEAEYLGYRVTPDGIAMREDFIQKVIDWPAPTTPKELSTFLGFVNYYRTFFKDFSMLTTEMNAQRKNFKLEWTETMQKKFDL